MLESLLEELKSLEEQAARIRASGEVLQGVRLVKIAPGGTAGEPSKSKAKYGQLRGIGRDGKLPSGQKTQYVALAEIDKVEAAIARGQQLTQVEKAIAKLQERIEKLK